MEKVSADRALFIKLGDGGRWEADCIRDGTIRLGYTQVPHDLCVRGDWTAARTAARGFSQSDAAATDHERQIREFYTAPPSVLWITFHADTLWWCFCDTGITPLPGFEKERKAIGGWRNTDIAGNVLLANRLSGKLLRVRGYRQTICEVQELDYLLHKINGTVEAHVAVAQAAYEHLQAALVPVIQKLHPKDLETLTDLIFRQSGWQRVGVLGGTERDIDLDLISPVTGERIAVQIKSRADAAVWRDYRERFASMRGFSRFYFVTHSPQLNLRQAAAGDETFILWDEHQLAAQAIRGGLVGWLLDKAA